MNIKKLRKQSGMELAPVAKAVRYEYPGFDLYLLSKVENAGRYGIRLLPRAQELADGGMAQREIVRATGLRSNTVSYYIRLWKDERNNSPMIKKAVFEGE